MKRKLKKAQTGTQIKSTGYKVPVTPKDTTSYGSATDRIKKALEKGKSGFYKTPESVGGRSGNIDPGFTIKPEKIGGKSGNIDPGFSKNPVKKKNGGAIKPKKKK
jgi:hypothetical protein